MNDGNGRFVRCADKERLNSIAAIDQRDVHVVTPALRHTRAFANHL